jgi:hypothetical protein
MSNKKIKRPSLHSLEIRYRELEQHFREWVKGIIGSWCKENGATFSYGMDVQVRVFVSDGEINEDATLIEDSTISVHRSINSQGVEGWCYDAEPDESVNAVLTKYEELFGIWFQSDCDKGVWYGV